MRVLISDCADIDKTLQIALEYKTGIEIQEFANANNLDGGRCDVNSIKEKIKNISLRGFHGPFADLIPASKDILIREATLSRFQKAYEYALALDSQHINFHANYIPKTYPKDIWMDNSVKFWTDFLIDKHHRINFHIENVYEDDFNLLIELFDKINSGLNAEAITATLDIGHANSNSSRSVEEWIKALNNRIRYVHLHNNGGILDDHFGLWKGNINIERTLDLLLEYSPHALWMIESRLPDIEQSAAWLKDKGYLNK